MKTLHAIFAERSSTLRKLIGFLPVSVSGLLLMLCAAAAQGQNEALTISETALTIYEGESNVTGTFTVELAANPSADVTVTLAQGGTANSDISFSPATLTFTEGTNGNWNTAQTVTVTVRNDSDGIDDKATINLTAEDGGYDSVTGSVAVTVKDPDHGISVSTSSLDVPEGGDASFTVRLNRLPTDDITIALSQDSSNSNRDVTFSPSSLAFTTSNWNIEQTVTVSAVDDDDDQDDNSKLALRVSGNSQYEADVDITVKDDTKKELILSKKVLTIVENKNERFTVRLATEPSDDVSVAVATGGTDSSKITLSTTTSLTFTTDNWNTAQPITVTAVDDSDNGSATVDLTASNGGYGDITGTVSVSLVDDDAAGLVAPASLSIDEDGSGTFEVRLTKAPTSNVTVTLAQDGTTNTDITFDTDSGSNGNQNSLTFTDSNWETAQEVTVTAAEDDDATADTTTIKLTATGDTDYTSVTDTVSITVNDDDTAGLEISKKNLSLNEDDSETFTVRLTTKPRASVTVTLGQPTNTDVTLDTDTDEANNQNTLTFTTTNWNAAQTVTVTAADDSDETPDAATINLTAEDGGYDNVIGNVSVSVADTDITLDTDNSMDPNEGVITNLGVKLSDKPSHNIYVSSRMSSGSSADVTRASADEYLVFTPENWNTDQQIGIAVAEDPDAVDERASTLILSASGFGYDIDEKRVTINGKDADAADLTLSPMSLRINEGEAATFEVSLVQNEPLLTGNEELRIFVRGSPSPIISLDTDESPNDVSNALIFTESNSNQPQTVRVSALLDPDSVDDTATITFEFAGDNAKYEGTSKTTMAVAITDSDKKALILSQTALTIAEGEESDDLTIRLTSEPSANVTVTLAQPSNANADVRVDTDTGSPGPQDTLTFTTANWRVPQAVRVAAAEDDDSFDDDADIVITASGGGYNIGAGDGNNVDVTVTDPDEPEITASTSYLAINENESGTFTVRLATQPRASVTVTLAPPSNTDVTVDTDPNTASDENTLTFTTSNWNTAQTVTVSAAEDTDTANDTATITISAADGGYGDADDVTVKITVGDDEASKVLASIEGLNIEEGEQESFRVRLTKEPTAAVTVTVAQPSPNPDITVDTNSGSSGNQSTLAFDDNNWDDWQTVTVSVASDGNDENEVGNIVISAEGGGYTATDSADNVTVTVMDDDEKGITLTASTLTVAEGQSVPLGIRLSAEPNGAVTVTLTQPQNTDVTIDTDAQTAGNQRTLTFTASNWDREQEVSVSAAQDNDASEDSATIVISVTGSNYTTTPPIEDVEVSVRVTESDTAAMTVSPASLQIVEGEGATITVSLSAPPSPSTENVTVALTRTGSTSVIFTPQTLIFTSSNWSTARSVGVIAAHDEDETDDSATITLRASGGGYDDIAAGSVSVAVEDDDAPGITTFPRSLTIAEEQSGFFVVRLSKEPSADVTLTLGQPANTDVTLDTDPSTPGNQNTLAFTTRNWRTPQGVSVSVTADSNSQTDTTSIPISATGATEYTNVTAQVAVEAIEDVNPNQPLTWTIRSSAPAIPPPSAQDSSTLRVRCLEGGKACNVYFDCSAQDGTRYHGPTPHLTIDSWNTQILTVANMVSHVGDWSGTGRGRLTCSVRSLEQISSQVWTRSGDGVLVNNSAMLRSVESQDAQGNATYQVDIESIPSPDDPVNRSNIRVRCEATGEECSDVTFVCYEDDGRLYSGVLGTIQSRHTRHLQAPDLANIINHRWAQTSLITCEVGTDAPFSVQVLTRTGGGGALVNNSASGGL